MKEGTRQDNGGRIAPATDIAGSVALVLAASATILVLIPIHTDASAASYDVSPAFVPKFAAWGVLILSLIQLALGLRNRAIEGATNTKVQPEWHVLIGAVAWLVIAVAIYLGLTKLGFLITAPVVLAFGYFATGQQRWIVAIPLIVAIPILLKFAAWQIFTVELP